VRQSNRCLLDCLCKDEMKCCKSVPNFTGSVGQASTVRAMNSVNTIDTQHRSDNVADDGDDTSRTYYSLPSILGLPRSQQSSADNASMHSLRTKPSDYGTPQVRPTVYKKRPK